MSSQISSVNVPTTTNSGNDGWTTVTQKRRGKKQAAPAQQSPAPEPVPEPAPVAAPAPEATPEPAPVKTVSIPATPAARAWASFRASNSGTAPAPAPAPAAPAPVAESVESESEAGDSEADVESVPETTVEQTPAPAAPAPAPAKATPVKAPSKPAASAAPAKPRAAPATKAPVKGDKVVRKLDFSKQNKSDGERKPQPNADAYKAALQKAEAAFFDECLPKAAPVGQLKGASDAVLRATAYEQLATPAEFQLNWQAVACKAPIGEDFEPVKVGDREVTFSRRKFAENSFFQKKLRTHYLSKLPANCWVAFRFVGKPATDKQPSSEALLIKVGNRLE